MRIVSFLFYSGIFGSYELHKVETSSWSVMKLNKLILISSILWRLGIMKIVYFLFYSGICGSYEPQKIEISTTQNVEIKQAHTYTTTTCSTVFRDHGKI